MDRVNACEGDVAAPVKSVPFIAGFCAVDRVVDVCGPVHRGEVAIGWPASDQRERAQVCLISLMDDFLADALFETLGAKPQDWRERPELLDCITERPWRFEFDQLCDLRGDGFEATSFVAPQCHFHASIAAKGIDEDRDV